MGALFYYANLTRGAVPPASRAELALYIALSAPKLYYLVKLLTTKREEGKKALVFLRSPITLYHGWLFWISWNFISFQSMPGTSLIKEKKQLAYPTMALTCTITIRAWC
ncbi:uncharacterized protein MCYG_08376 [Microsporum canis CBS 113480]|uniref:Uncharacterized protein n=1 Tax=Arthroderma otae (strain ATCC MYA-4605 / CBS 113480) TaxID=554155 RepID=C5G0A4_ARTOC|nr:uncharacterized protein MCYG_08376 [Microsporum canis CBS 113480]EEQ35557.1 predicted protein [Microsporum canis CBS 113480]